METRRLYYDDPLKLEFTAEVVEVRALPEGHWGAILPVTYFYATGGGQEHDTGIIGEARVIDVTKEEDNGIVIHVLDRALTPGSYLACIDVDRRLSNMQHHTGQHLLSAAFVHVLGIDSLSANINWNTPSTIDLDTHEISQADWQRVEEYANQVIFANRVVKSYFVNDAEAARIPFRKPPAVSGNIRVIEIDGLDHTPCGGTHCLQTGMIGLLKIVKIERQNQKLRVHFVAGMQALRLVQQYQGIVQAAVSLFDTGPDMIVDSITRQMERLKSAQAELDTLRSEHLAFEALRLAQSAEPLGASHLVKVLFHDRTPAELRILANNLRETPGIIGVLGSLDGQKLSLVVCCSAQVGVNARDLLGRLLSKINGRGGGDATLAQGGGPADETQAAQLIATVAHAVHEVQDVK